MTFEDLSEWVIQVGAGEKLSPQVRERIRSELPPFIRSIDPSRAPKRLKLPTGESLGDATRLTAIKCHCLLLARKAGGPGFFKQAPEYGSLAKDLLFWVMRHHFNTGDPKGVFCCPPCTPPLRPWLLPLGGGELKSAVLDALAKRQSVFQRNYPKAYAQWAAELAGQAPAIPR